MEEVPEEFDPKMNLSKRILKVDKNILLNQDLYINVKGPILEGYKDTSKLRKEFHKDFLPDFDSNLGFPSSKEFYNYENFFKEKNYPKFDLANDYFYNNDLNLFNRNNSPLNKKNETNKNKNKEKKSESDINSNNKNIKNENDEEEFSNKKVKKDFRKNNKEEKI